MRRILEFLFFFQEQNQTISSKQWKIEPHTMQFMDEIRKKEKERPKNDRKQKLSFLVSKSFWKVFFLKIIRAHFVSNYIIRYTLWLYLFNHSLSSSHDRERVECNVSYLSQRKHVHVWLHARIIDCRATILRRHSSTYVRYTYRSTFCQRIHA